VAVPAQLFPQLQQRDRLQVRRQVVSFQKDRLLQLTGVSKMAFIHPDNAI